jgi:O-antigen/teichoic acid export membrane protein
MERPYGFYSSLGLLVLLNAIIKPLWIFAIDRQVQNVVGTENYGVYFSLLSLSVVLSFLADWGFTPFFNQRLAADRTFFENLSGNFLLWKLLFALLYCLVLFTAAWLSGIKRWDILIYVTLIQVFTSLFVFFRSVITASQWFKADAWLSITDKTLMIIGCGILLYLPSLSGSMNIDRFLLLQTVFLGFAMVISFLFLVKKNIRFIPQNNWLPSRHIIGQALPFGMVYLLMSTHSRIDAFLLERLHSNGAYESGIYAGAFRLLDAANMCGYLVASFMLPYIARRWSSQAEINSVVLRCRHFLLMVATGIIATAIFLGPWIQQVLYHHNDDYAVGVLRYCLAAMAGYSLVHIYGTALTATGRVIEFSYIVLISVLINCTLNLLLIPTLGAKGACLAALCSQLFCGISTMLYARQKIHTALNIRSLLIYIFTGLLLAGFYYTFRNGPIPEWLRITLAAGIVATIMLLTRLAGIAQLIKAVRKQD